MSLWSRITGRKSIYKQCTLEEFIDNCEDKPFGEEARDMFVYSSEPGYDGGEAEGRFVEGQFLSFLYVSNL
jgi:hypothetical protein